VAIVTGGATGIGRAVALGMGAHGAKVVIGDWSAAGAETARAITAAGGDATFIKTDVSSEKDAAALVEVRVRVRVCACSQFAFGMAQRGFHGTD
jgi:NAD(P)-dependent dehydrogenase (short-subunit alcohol dehydrogenase family)